MKRKKAKYILLLIGVIFTVLFAVMYIKDLSSYVYGTNAFWAYTLTQLSPVIIGGLAPIIVFMFIHAKDIEDENAQFALFLRIISALLIAFIVFAVLYMSFSIKPVINLP
ncbi:MAG: hypothetical protein HN948_04985 [Clostridia bacterium]|jgi:hypothetical protein|nr:hypothetical protein [Clostridia bacterium]MBT7122346.1 hypothetical protein [Clostridia bacterium]